jgi:hypothetical protein
MSVDDPPPDDGTGGPVPHDISGQINDLRASVHHPIEDLLFPSALTIDEWLADASVQDLKTRVADQGYQQAKKAEDNYQNARNKRSAARQNRPDLQLISKGIEEIADRPTQGGTAKRAAPSELHRTVERSVSLFERLRKDWIHSNVTEPVDLRAPWFQIRNQGKSASCVGHAIADMIELQLRACSDPPSARFIWQAAKEKDGDNRPTTMIATAGTSLRAGLQIVREFGYATESELPTRTNEPYRGDLDEFYQRLANRKASLIVNLGRGTKSWMAWLYQGQGRSTDERVRCPIVARMTVGDNFLGTRVTRRLVGDELTGEAIVRGERPPRGPDCFAHAVLIVGYRFLDVTGGTVADLLKGRKTDEEMPVQYLIRNSAGRNWGDRGYAWISQEDLCAQADEAFGLIFPDDLKRLPVQDTAS